DFAARHPEVAGRQTWEEFVSRVLRLEVLGGEEGGATLVNTQQILLGTWTRAWQYLALGDDEHAIGLAALAKRTYDEGRKIVLQKIQEGDPTAATRLSSASLAEIKQRAFEDVRAKLPPPLRARLEERAGVLSKEADK